MKIYLAAPYRQKETIRRYAQELRDGGIVVTSSWLEEPHKPTTQMDELTPEEHQKYAIQDVKDVMAADILVLFTDPTQTIVRQGRTAEMGMFIGRRAVEKKGLPIFVVGTEFENIFHYLPQVTHFKSWHVLADLLIMLATDEMANA